MLFVCSFAYSAPPPAPEIVPIEQTDVSQVDTPTINPSDPASIIGYWEFLYVLLMPIGSYVLARFWPSNTKQSLTLKTSIFAITILIAIISVKGLSVAIIVKAFTLFVSQALLYDKILQPAGLNSKKEYK